MADDLTAELERIRERYERGNPHLTQVCTPGSPHDVPHLLAAVEAVLELHRPVDRGTGAQCKGCATHVTFTWWPCPTYEAITAALAGTGKEGGEDG